MSLFNFKKQLPKERPDIPLPPVPDPVSPLPKTTQEANSPFDTPLPKNPLNFSQPPKESHLNESAEHSLPSFPEEKPTIKAYPMSAIENDLPHHQIKKEPKVHAEPIWHQKISAPPMQNIKPEAPIHELKKEFDGVTKAVVRDKFIPMQEYTSILIDISKINSTLNAASANLNNGENLEEKENEQLAAWGGILEDMQRKLIFIDKVLFE